MTEGGSARRALIWHVPLLADILAAGAYRFDRKANFWGKVPALLALVYTIVPTDLAPDILPLFGWLDGAGVLALVPAYYHKKLAPSRARILGAPPQTREKPDAASEARPRPHCARPRKHPTGRARTSRAAPPAWTLPSRSYCAGPSRSATRAAAAVTSPRSSWRLRQRDSKERHCLR